jgi:membrane protein required for colicin V production
MNTFDGIVYLALIVAVVTGFNTGLLRGAVTILAYLIAMPIAVAVTPLLAQQVGVRFATPFMQNSLLFFAVFLIAGMVLGKAARMALDDTVGSAGFGDRLGGMMLGAVRVGLVAVTMVLAFDQLVPADRQPSFLAGSQLRPLLSKAGQLGVRSLPPEVIATIDRLKHEQRI